MREATESSGPAVTLQVTEVTGRAPQAAGPSAPVVTAVDPEIGFAAAALLSRWWSRPTAAEREAWDGVWPVALETAAALGVSADPVQQLHSALRGSSTDAMLDEYERLLVGPGRAPCSPYESLWRTDVARREQGVLMGAISDAVTDIYLGLGLELRGDAHELPDHLVVEWEAVAYAFEHGADEAAGQLLGEHLQRWMSPFCEAVGLESGERFYQVLAAVTRGWTTALA